MFDIGRAPKTSGLLRRNDAREYPTTELRIHVLEAALLAYVILLT